MNAEKNFKGFASFSPLFGKVCAKAQRAEGKTSALITGYLLTTGAIKGKIYLSNGCARIGGKPYE